MSKIYKRPDRNGFKEFVLETSLALTVIFVFFALYNSSVTPPGGFSFIESLAFYMGFCVGSGIIFFIFFVALCYSCKVYYKLFYKIFKYLKKISD